MIVQLKFNEFGLSIEHRCRLVGEIGETLVNRNLMFLKDMYGFTPLYQMKHLRYEAHLGPWKDIPTTLQEKTGDCKEFACWRVAELRLMGEDAQFHVVGFKKENQAVFHLQVRREDGTIEDPALHMGMRPLDSMALLGL